MLSIRGALLRLQTTMLSWVFCGIFLALLWRPIWSTEVILSLPNAWCFYNGKTLCINRKIKRLLELMSSNWCLLGTAQSKFGGWRCECYPQTGDKLQGKGCLVGFTPGCSENVTLCYSAPAPQPLKYNPVSERFYENKCINTYKSVQA